MKSWRKRTLNSFESCWNHELMVLVMWGPQKGLSDINLKLLSSANLMLFFEEWIWIYIPSVASSVWVCLIDRHILLLLDQVFSYCHITQFTHERPPPPHFPCDSSTSPITNATHVPFSIPSFTSIVTIGFQMISNAHGAHNLAETLQYPILALANNL